ncbi:MAG: N-acetyltransferase [Candidatus Accumulibacter sp.]|jgi:putative acetyltransferase|nr:N-acetyltransferase [Accumulibacter sp.]
MTLAIRQESPSDITAIHALTKDAFLNTPHTAGTEQFIVDALRNANALSMSLVAEEDGVILGHVAISPVSISDGASSWYSLGPISVIPEHQRQGIGSKLMFEVLQRLKEKGASGCVLVGDPAYYARFGFSQEKRLVFPDVPSEYFQAISFSPPLPQGVVKFHEAFGAKG